MEKALLKQAKVSEDSRYYKYVAPSTEKEGKDASITSAVSSMKETNEAVEATPSKEDKTIVEYKKEDVSTVKADGTTKTETEIAKEVVNNAIEDSKKDDSVIIAVKTETVENATKTEIKQDDVPIVEPVEETTSTITTDVVIENCTDIVSDNFEDLNWD